MTVSKEALVQAIRQAKEQSKPRNFEQSMELLIALEGLDPKKPESRITLDVVLPHGLGKPNRVFVFADGELARLAREGGADRVMGKGEIQRLQGQRKEIKKIAEQFDMCLAQADLMVLIGKVFGPVLGPRGKMPRPIPATANPVPIIERLRRTVRLMNKGQLCLNTKIGSEKMDEGQLAENALAVLEEVDRKLSDLGGRIKTVYVKTTMGKPVKIGMVEG